MVEGRMRSRRMIVAVAVAVALAVHPSAASAVGFSPLSGIATPSRPSCPPPEPGQAQCLSEVVATALVTPQAFAAPAGYGPADLQDAYGVAAAASSRGDDQTIAIVDAYDNPYAESDLAEYRRRFGLPPCRSADGCFRKVDQRGGSRFPSPNGGWGLEIALDLDMASGLCPRCRLLLVEADSEFFSDLAAAVNRAAALGATQISNSYGAGEVGQSDNAYDHPGIAITASAGDYGYGVMFPASSPHVIAVGGTTLRRDANAGRGWQETVWSESGSGCSGYAPKPSWQRDSGCRFRSVADVAADADPSTGAAVYDTWRRPGWVVVGGTSEAAPIVAAIDALVGPEAASPAYPYAHPEAYNDVTTGSNGSCDTSYLCHGAPGYDGPTGVGTPRGPGRHGPPAAVTGPASDATTSSATATGTVNPNGLATTARFEYGPSAAYGLTTPAVGVGSDGIAHPVAVPLAGLNAGSTYHYRMVAASAAGAGYGADMSFSTSPAPVAPVAPAPPPAVALSARRASRLELRVPGQRLRAVVKRGLVVRVRSSRARRVALAVSLDAASLPGLAARQARGLVVIGSGAVRLKAGRVTAEAVTLRTRARSLLRRWGRRRALRVTVSARAPEPGWGAALTTTLVTLRG